MDEIDEEEEIIAKALDHYIKHKKRCAEYYRNRYHNDEIFREKHKALARQYYQKNKEAVAAKYQIEKKYKQALRKYNYYKEKGELDFYKQKFNEDFELYFNGTKEL
tara:strand:+ start:40 stop:357 length:318 start_codon:yes stop_codon:yes gene_type:complete